MDTQKSNNNKSEEENNEENNNETENMSCEETTNNNIQVTDDEEMQTNNNHLTPSEANLFQTFLRMAVAMFLTVWAISQSFFYIDTRLAITDSSSSFEYLEEEQFNLKIMDENKEERIKKKTKKRNKKNSSSSSSRESSPERVEEEEEDNNNNLKHSSPSLKIDSNLLHTDNIIPKILIEQEDYLKKNEQEENENEENEKKFDDKNIINPSESPPLQIETVGVLLERRKKELEEKQKLNIPSTILPSQFFMFKSDREEEKEEEPMFRRLDAIVEEDSDELRSAQSSRASTARTQKICVSPEDFKKEEKEEENNKIEPPKMPSHFKFLFERQQSEGNSSHSSGGAKIVELSTPEEEEDKIIISPPKVPRLDLEGVSLENSEVEEEGQTTTREGISPPISDTDTILIIEEEEEHPKEEKEKEENIIIIKNNKVTFVENEKKDVEDKEHEEEKKMFSSTTRAALIYQHPSDADRDQGEVFASLADQHIPMPPPMEDGRLSSPSMSINLDRSRESLDHSICSVPTQEVAENIPDELLFSLSSPIILSSNNNLINNGGRKDIICRKDFDFLIQKNVDKDLLTITTNGIDDLTSKKQSEKASSTSSSSPAVYIRKTCEEEEEEPMPLPPPTTTTTNSNGLLSSKLIESSFPISSKRQDEYPLPPPLPTLPPISSPESVFPLWGRNERLTSYLHGYGGNFTKNLKKRQEEGGEEGKENGNINNNYIPPPSYNKWLENERKTIEEKQREEGRAWTVHPITLKERPSSRSTQKDEKRTLKNGERNIPIKIHNDMSLPFSSSTDWFNAHFPLNDSLWPYTSGFRGFQQSMSSELPPLRPYDSLQQPSSLYGGSSAKESPTAFASIGAFDRSFESSSRSDFMSAIGGDNQRNGRQQQQQINNNNNNIREIPIQRSASAFAPSIGGIMSSGINRPIASTTTTTAPPPTSHNEYYRREVLTRTLVTRSTEALSAPPPLSRSPPTVPLPPPLRPLDVDLPPRRDLPSEEYWVRYSRNIEEEERRLRSEQEHRRRLEEDRRLRVEEQRRRLEQQEQELVEKLRREREQLGKTLEAQMIDRERAERDKIHQDRLDRETTERRRREEWDRIERERRAYEENELDKRRELERIEKERIERERLEAERLERERLERQKLELERIEKQRVEQERIERERLEIERIEIERIERIKREKREQEEREKERQRQEALKLQKVREDLERAERERFELERQARELYEREQREEAERQREREREALKEAKRREEERLARERLERAEREAMEREIARRARERTEQERLELLRKEKERIEQEQLEAEKRERERLEQERKEREMIESAILARERRDQERREERERERQRQEEERLENERRQRERIEAQQRERDRQMQEQQERDRLAQLEAIAAERRGHRALEERQQRERLELERRTEELKEIERLEQEKRERERTSEELRLSELREKEQRMAVERERERREAQEREERRQREGWRSREMLEQLARERDEKASWEAEKRRLLEEHEIQERKRQGLTSKETLERLTRRPYYSRENLADYPDLTTKVERQVIERVDRTLWTDTTDPRPTSPNGLAYYGGPNSNGGIPPPFYGTDLGSHHHHPPPSAAEREEFTSGGGRESSRLYQPRADEQDWLRRGGSSRTSKYRQRMERARREFISGTPNEYPPPSNFDPLLDRCQKSSEDLLYGRRPPSEYRGPLLQRFNSGEFSHPPEPTIGLASGLGRSPYELEFQRLLEKARNSLAHYYRLKKPPSYWSYTGLNENELFKAFFEGKENALKEDIHRSKSVLDAYSPTSRERYSRREFVEQEESTHTRSKSADYLMDPRRPREEPTIPENDLQKGLLGEHELRFRKSTERMQVPDWYRDYYYPRQQQQPIIGGYGPPSATTSGVFSSETAPTITTGLPYTRPEPPLSSYYGKDLTTTSRPWHYAQQPLPSNIYGSSPPLCGISFPTGMFDKYKDEIEDLRRSRGSLHQLGGFGGEREGTKTTTNLQEHTKPSQQPKILIEGNTITREYSKEAFSKTQVQTLAYPTGNHQPGYTVSTVPTEWRMAPKERQNSRVVEVVDTFVDRPTATDGQPLVKRYGGRLTLEEVLDSIFQSTQYIPDIPPIDPSNYSDSQFKNIDGPGIFTPKEELMNKLAEQPHLAEKLLKNEPIYVRCSNCQLIRLLSEAKNHYCWCRHCYTYYCSRSCRQRDWEKHRDRCSFARINSLCKEVIMKVRHDPETQFHMSRVAREGFRREGRGSVNIRLISAYSAQLYLEKGWQVFARHDPNQLLFYYPIQALIDQRKEPSLIQLCRKYNPNEKFILSVSIIADVEQCPETPPPLEPTTNDKNNNINNKFSEHSSPSFGQKFVYGTAVPTNV